MDTYQTPKRFKPEEISAAVSISRDILHALQTMRESTERAIFATQCSGGEIALLPLLCPNTRTVSFFAAGLRKATAEATAREMHYAYYRGGLLALMAFFDVDDDRIFIPTWALADNVGEALHALAAAQVAYMCKAVVGLSEHPSEALPPAYNPPVSLSRDEAEAVRDLKWFMVPRIGRELPQSELDEMARVANIRLR